MDIDNVITTLDNLSKKYCKVSPTGGSLYSLGLLLYDRVTGDAYECAEKGYEPGSRFESYLMATVDVNRLIGFAQGLEYAKQSITSHSNDITAEFEGLSSNGMVAITVPNRSQSETAPGEPFDVVKRAAELGINIKHSCHAESMKDVDDFLNSLVVTAGPEGADPIVSKKDDDYSRIENAREMLKMIAVGNDPTEQSFIRTSDYDRYSHSDLLNMAIAELETARDQLKKDEPRSYVRPPEGAKMDMPF